MTIEAGSAGRGVVRLLQTVCILLGIVAGWFAAITAATAAWGPVGTAVLVIGTGMPSRLPEGAGILRANGTRTVVSASDAASVRNLYAHGAWLVLPALRNGCMELRPA